jgi:phosphotransferase system  glucose/maltose/N-acetylglucosamine-specific IIC component
MFGSIVSGIFGVLVFLFMAALGLACFAFWLWMLIHAITNKGLGDGEKIVWVIVVIFLPVLGPILYFFIGRPKAIG